MARVFADRRDAGRRLAHRLGDLGEHGENRSGEVVVLGLPRGGVPVAAEVAAALGAPLDILVVGKVGVPGHEELAVGRWPTTADRRQPRRHRRGRPVGRRRAGRPGRAPRGGTGTPGHAELRAGRRDPGRRRRPDGGRGRRRHGHGGDDAGGPRRGPSARRPPGHRRRAGGVARGHLAGRRGGRPGRCVLTPRDFQAVGPWYDDFTQVGDDEVRDVLAARMPSAAPEGADDP